MPLTGRDDPPKAVAESVDFFSAEVDRWRSVFLGVVAHDLRGPIGHIRMAAELLKMRMPPDSDPKVAEKLEYWVKERGLHGMRFSPIYYRDGRHGGGIAQIDAGESLEERGLAAYDDDDRTIADLLVDQIEFADVERTCTNRMDDVSEPLSRTGPGPFVLPAAWLHDCVHVAKDDPARPKSHDTGPRVKVGGATEGDLMIIQGPLGFRWKHRKWGILPRIEKSDIRAVAPATPDRIDAWVETGIHVQGRPEWIH